MTAEEEFGVYSPDTARMVLEVIRQLKAQGYAIKAGDRTPAITGAPRGHIAYVTQTITARSDSDAGLGKAVLIYIPGVAGTDVAMAGYPPDSPADVWVYNFTMGDIDTGKYIYIDREYASGKWVVVVEEC